MNNNDNNEFLNDILQKTRANDPELVEKERWETLVAEELVKVKECVQRRAKEGYANFTCTMFYNEFIEAALRQLAQSCGFKLIMNKEMDAVGVSWEHLI